MSTGFYPNQLNGMSNHRAQPFLIHKQNAQFMLPPEARLHVGNLDRDVSTNVLENELEVLFAPFGTCWAQVRQGKANSLMSGWVQFQHPAHAEAVLQSDRVGRFDLRGRTLRIEIARGIRQLPVYLVSIVTSIDSSNDTTEGHDQTTGTVPGFPPGLGPAYMAPIGPSMAVPMRVDNTMSLMPVQLPMHMYMPGPTKPIYFPHYYLIVEHGHDTTPAMPVSASGASAQANTPSVDRVSQHAPIVTTPSDELPKDSIGLVNETASKEPTAELDTSDPTTNSPEEPKNASQREKANQASDLPLTITGRTVRDYVLEQNSLLGLDASDEIIQEVILEVEAEQRWLGRLSEPASGSVSVSVRAYERRIYGYA
ncbi:uncharacterized protein BO80DRAFT_470506 [Aspergillus ibericus CBS 121593]|uniref:RRM domain-containing protein n=1 Tax=Aspergillus ibericus CBS 121593 TaxID=1448316 RepID=A0A395HG01_9EURO|nr:hypothetical protein BO80DRAFT_470506 [Aspergillus ibericus CBS 121593]RAL06403.1 hypothetical protein BO80DRAFT_470506 [Aspergillus ibericus CBS 121593]